MRYYCLLIIRSNSKGTASSIFRAKALDVLGFEDTCSEVNLARAERWRKSNSSVQFIERSDLPRYCWSLTSLSGIDEKVSDPFEHVSWLMSQLKRGVSLANVKNQGVECVLAFYWGGLGSGGGPLITPGLSNMLVQHNIDLSIGFYMENQA